MRIRPGAPYDVVKGEERMRFRYKAPSPDFAKMEEPCRKKGIMKTNRIGEATVKLLRLNPLIESFAKALKENPGIFYE